MANLNARDEELDEIMDGEGDFEDEAIDTADDEVVSDSRARRKRNRGEAVFATTEKKGRPTPSRNAKAVSAVDDSFLTKIPLLGRPLNAVVEYFRGVYAEMQKVTWPTRTETNNLTRLVLIVTLGFAVGLGLIDTFYTWWFGQAFDNNTGIFLAVAGVVVLVSAGLVWFTFYRGDDRTPYQR